MSEVSFAVVELARQLLAHEARGRRGAEELGGAAERACWRLRQHLMDVIGPAGFDALFARALSLAQADSPALERIAFAGQSDVCLRGVREFAAAADPVEARDGLAAILAHFIRLLAAFIGEELGVRLIREGWPELAQGGEGPLVRRHGDE